MEIQEVKEKPIKSGVCVDWLEFTLFWQIPEILRGENVDIVSAILTKNKPDSEDEKEYGRLLEKFRPDSQREEFSAFDAVPFTVDSVSELLGIYGFNPEKQRTGAAGYRSRYVTEAGIVILADGMPEMGVHVTVSGQVCQNIDDIFGLIATIRKEGGKFTRIDLAIDDCDKALDLEKMVKKCQAGECSSRLKDFLVMKGGKIADGKKTGLTLYIGKKESDFMTRIYDKRLQSIYVKKIRAKDLPGHWLRVEMECKGAAAKNAAIAVIENPDNFAGIAAGILKNYINFKDRTEDDNKSRWPVSAFWSAFIGRSEKLSISKQILPTDINKRLNWLKKQCSKSIAVVLQSHGPEELTQAVEGAEKTLTCDDRMQIWAEKRKVERKKKKEKEDLERLRDVGNGAAGHA